MISFLLNLMLIWLWLAAVVTIFLALGWLFVVLGPLGASVVIFVGGTMILALAMQVGL